MAILSYGEIQNLRTVLRQGMEQHLPKWRQLAENISPHRIKLDNKKVDGARKDGEIINGQATRSLRTFVSGMMNGATPRSRPWFNLTSSDPSTSKSSDVKRYYSETEKVLNSHFQTSNLYRVLPLAYKDVGIFSNAAFAMLPHARYGFYFYPFAIGTYAFACDKEGRSNMFTRDFTLTVRQVVETYASVGPAGQIDWKNIPNNVRELWGNSRYLEEIQLAQVVIPNSTYNAKVVSLNPADKKFQSYTYVVGGNVNGLANQNPSGFREQNQDPDMMDHKSGDSSQFLKIGGFDYFPIITPRWEVEPEGFYGVDGPGEIALSDVLTLQKQEKYRFEAIQKLVRPPMVGHSSLRRHQSSILAGGITYVDDRGMAHGFKPAFELNPQLSDLIGSKLEIEDHIKTAFYEDLFRQLSSENKISHVTAAEINQRTAETMAAMAPVLGQWDHDMSGPLIENAQIILQEQGRLPKRPAELENKSIVPEYISTLAQASKASLITSQEKFIGLVAQTATVLQDPTLLKMAKGEEQIRDFADNLGINPNLVTDELEFKKIKEASQQAQAAEVANQQADREANRAKTLSDTPIGKGTALDQAI